MPGGEIVRGKRLRYRAEEIGDLLDLATASKPTYVHDQIVAMSTWHVQHNLGRNPAVSIVDSANSVVLGDIDYLDTNSLRVTFSVPFSGKVYCN